MGMISFSYTTPPLMAGVKTWTWREWAARYAAQFHRGDFVDAWDRSPRNGGRKVAVIRLTADPIQMTTDRLTPDDYESEGLGWLARHPEACPKVIWGQPFHLSLVSREYYNERRRDATPGYKVQFELIEVLIENPWRKVA